MKISVIGYSGSGKSTLARALGQKYSLPVLHLDSVQFLPGWEIRPLEEGRDAVREFMRQDGWVIDGNYRKFFRDERLAESDLIVFMNFPRRICIPSAVSRFYKFRGTVRPDMAEGCDEKLDLEFLWWLIYEGRTKKIRDGYREICRKYSDKTIVLKNRREVRRFMEKGSL